MLKPVSPPEPSWLARFLPFRRLTPLALILLAGRLRAFEVPAGFRLADFGETDSDELFLLEGRLQVLARDGQVRDMEAGAANSLGAVAHLRPRQFRITSATTARLFAVPHSIIGNLQDAAAANANLDELGLDMREDDDRLYAALLVDLPQQQVRLPVTRQGAALARSLLNDPASTPQQLAQLAMLEPALALRLIGAANHPVFAEGPAVQSCQEAVARLGVTTARRVLQLFIQQAHVPDRLSPMAPAIQNAVLRSREVAWLCAQLAELSPPLTVARAYLVGLLHEVGELIALAYAENWPEIYMDEARFQRCRENLRASLSATVLRAYGLNSDYLLAASSANEWQREGGPLADYCDLVILAQLHAVIGTQRVRDVPAMASVPAFARVASGALDPQRSLQMIQQARQRAHAAQLPQDHRAA